MISKKKNQIMKNTLLICILLVFSFIQCNAQIDFDSFILQEEVSSPTLKKVFPDVNFNCATRNSIYFVIIGEYENKKYLFDVYTFQFNTLYDKVKDKNNCTLEEKLIALIEIFSYAKENYKVADIGIIKYEENKFSIDTLYEKSNLVGDQEFQWYSKYTSQDGFIEIYFQLDEDYVNEIYVMYNGNINGIFRPVSYNRLTKE